MDTYRSDDEQVAAIKNFMKQYGWIIIVAVVIGLLLSAAWGLYHDRRANYQAEADDIYVQLLESVWSEDVPLATSLALQLQRDYTDTSYASFSALLLAKLAVAQNDEDMAETQLQWVIGHNRDPALVELAYVSLARVILVQQRSEEAIHYAQQALDGPYAVLAWDALGDAYVQQQQYTEADEAYLAALRLLARTPAGFLQEETQDKILWIELKRNNQVLPYREVTSLIDEAVPAAALAQ